MLQRLDLFSKNEDYSEHSAQTLRCVFMCLCVIMWGRGWVVRGDADAAVCGEGDGWCVVILFDALQMDLLRHCPSILPLLASPLIFTLPLPICCRMLLVPVYRAELTGRQCVPSSSLPLPTGTHKLSHAMTYTPLPGPSRGPLSLLASPCSTAILRLLLLLLRLLLLLLLLLLFRLIRLLLLSLPPTADIPTAMTLNATPSASAPLRPRWCVRAYCGLTRHAPPCP